MTSSPPQTVTVQTVRDSAPRPAQGPVGERSVVGSVGVLPFGGRPVLLDEVAGAGGTIAQTVSHSSWWCWTRRRLDGAVGAGGWPTADRAAALSLLATTAEAISFLRHFSEELWFTRPPA